MSPEYAEKISRAYLQKIGRGLVLSPKDYQYIQRWAAAGIPCELVLAAIETAFSQPPVTKVRTLGYISGALEDLVRKWRKMRVGENDLASDASPFAPQPLEPLMLQIEAVVDTCGDPQVIGLLKALILDLEGFAGHMKSDGDFDIHGALEALEHAFLDEVFLVIPALEKAELVSKIDQRMASEDAVSMSMKAEIRTACVRRYTREYLGLPPLELSSGRGW